MKALTRQEYEEWRQHPVTLFILTSLEKKREELKENLVLDNYENEDFVKGKASAILEILEMQYTDVMEV